MDIAPVILRTAEPEFPESARKMGFTGKVIAKFMVGADAHVSRVSILGAVPEGVFEQDVVKALKQWAFKPGYSSYLKNRAVSTRVVLPINFRFTR